MNLLIWKRRENSIKLWWTYMHFYFEMRIGFLFLFLERGMKNAISKNSKRKILDYAKWLFWKYKLNSRDFMVYCFLVSKKDKKGKSYWSIKRMSEQCNMSYESVRRAIKSLEDQCLIDVEHCSVNGKKNSNIYTVHRLIWFCFLLLHFWCINNIKGWTNEKKKFFESVIFVIFTNTVNWRCFFVRKIYKPYYERNGTFTWKVTRNKRSIQFRKDNS